jgi:hypothetical protein
VDNSAPSKPQRCSMSATLADILAPFPAKRLARAAGAHPKTAQRWREGATAPNGDTLLRLMTDDELLSAILRAIGRADEAARQHAISILTREAP